MLSCSLSFRARSQNLLCHKCGTTHTFAFATRANTRSPWSFFCCYCRGKGKAILEKRNARLCKLVSRAQWDFKAGISAVDEEVSVAHPVPMQACFLGNGSNHKCKKVKEGESTHVFGKCHPHDISICSPSTPNPFIRLNGVLSISLSGLIFDNFTNNMSMVNH